MNDADQPWMRRALELAERGRGHVEPNPLVGAVVDALNDFTGAAPQIDHTHIWLRLHQPPNTVDDAYITFRYARNIASGVGFVYNAGDPVLGTTTPAYALLLAAVSRLAGFYDYPRLALMVNTLLNALSFGVIIRLTATLVPGPLRSPDSALV